MKNAIIVSQVSKVYRVPSLLPWKPPKRATALKKVSFSCPAGKTTCLLGPNGAGKTTIVKILAGLIHPDSGQAAFSEDTTAAHGHRGSFSVGVAASNERSFYWRLTGRQNLDFFSVLLGINGSRKKERIMRCLEQVGLQSEADKPVRLYSSGMKQKLLLARALLGDPDILLLDEPTTHLDPVARSAVHTLVRDGLVQRDGKTVLLCTNDLHEAQELSDHLVLLNNGVTVAEGALNTLYSKIKQSLNLVMSFERLPETGWDKGFDIVLNRRRQNTFEYLIPSREVVPDLIEAAVQKGARLYGCTCTEPSLAEVFEHVVVPKR